MTVTLRTYDDLGTPLAMLLCEDVEGLRSALEAWSAPAQTALIEIHRDGDLWLRVFPDGVDQPPLWDSRVADVLSRVTAVTFYNAAQAAQGKARWDAMFPSDPLIAVAADVITAERLVVLRSCVPDSRALPGDWAPAALLRSVADELTAERLSEVLHVGDPLVEDPLARLAASLPSVEETLGRLSEIDWAIGERARLLLVARGWIAPLDAG